MNFDFFTVERVTVVSVGCFIIIIVKNYSNCKKNGQGNENSKRRKRGKNEKSRFLASCNNI